MTKTRPGLAAIWAAAAMAALVVCTAAAQDPLQVSPDHYKLAIDNDWVRVLRVTAGPHEKLPMHAQPASLILFLADARVKLTDAAGHAREITRKAGEVAYSDAGRFAEENLSDKPLAAVLVELKPNAPKNSGPPITLDPTKSDPEHVTVEFENARVRVLHTVLPPHIKDLMHEHPHYVVVYLTDLHTTMALANGKLIDNVRHPGEIAWRDYMKHSTENMGDRDAVEIQFELK